MVPKDRAFHRKTVSTSKHLDAWKPAEITPLDDGRGPLPEAARAILILANAGIDARIRYFDGGGYMYEIDGKSVLVQDVLNRAKGL